MVCSDTSAVHSIITIKQDEDKIIPVDSHKLFCVAGEAGDRVQFSDYVIANVKLYALRNETQLSTKSVANYARTELANALRRSPYHCNLLVAGYDKGEGGGASLYWLDYLATLHKVNTGGTGYGSYFTLSLFDKLWHPELTEAEALSMMEKGIEEIRRRLVVAAPKFVVKVVDANGIRTVAELKA